MGKIWLTCKKATFLMSKKEEGKLTFTEMVQLKLHLLICSYCTRFLKQTKLMKRRAPHLHEHLHVQLSPEKKEALQKMLQ